MHMKGDCVIQLNEQQEEFCQHYIKTNNRVRSYKKAYDTDRTGYAQSRANKLLQQEKIKGRIQELRDKINEKFAISVEELDNMCMIYWELAKKKKSLRFMGTAIELRMKLHGHYNGKEEIKNKITTNNQQVVVYMPDNKREDHDPEIKTINTNLEDK